MVLTDHCKFEYLSSISDRKTEYSLSNKTVAVTVYMPQFIVRKVNMQLFCRFSAFESYIFII